VPVDLDLIFDLSQAVRAQQALSFQGQTDQLEFAECTFPEPLHYRLQVTPVEEQIWLSGEAKGLAVMECRRCLEPVATPVTARFQYLMEFHPEIEGIMQSEGAEELYWFGELELDLSGLIAESVFAALPLTVICQPQCQGLCPECGANLNHSHCEHPGHKAPSPLDELAHLFDEE
jgi:uncharacterized protein